MNQTPNSPYNNKQQLILKTVPHLYFVLSIIAVHLGERRSGQVGHTLGRTAWLTEVGGKHRS